MAQRTIHMLFGTLLADKIKLFDKNRFLIGSILPDVYKNRGVTLEKDILTKFKMNDRDEAVKFLKSLWCETPQPCPLCGGKLDYLHKKAKKSNCDWICTICGQRYDTINMLDELNER